MIKHKDYYKDLPNSYEVNIWDETKQYAKILNTFKRKEDAVNFASSYLYNIKNTDYDKKIMIDIVDSNGDITEQLSNIN